MRTILRTITILGSTIALSGMVATAALAMGERDLPVDATKAAAPSVATATPPAKAVIGPRIVDDRPR